MNRLLTALALIVSLGTAPLSMAANGSPSPAPTLGQLMGLHTQGVNYQLGRGVPQDLAAAARWYLRSARLGYADSQNDLAKLYEDGRGVPRDAARAWFWYTLAIENGNGCAALDRGKLAENMSQSHLAEGEAMLQSWRAVEAITSLE